MSSIWNKFGDKYLSKIKIGYIKVTYPDGIEKDYGIKGHMDVELSIKDSSFFRRLAFYGDIGFAESYMDGDFECSDLTKLIQIAILNSDVLQTNSEDEKSFSLYNALPWFNKIKHSLRKNSKTRSQKNISQHYDLSNEFFKLMLDDTMMYSGAIFSDKNEDLYAAQKI